jgi:hypothetical protein
LKPISSAASTRNPIAFLWFKLRLEMREALGLFAQLDEALGVEE